VFGLEKYRAQNWQIARVSRRASATFALQYVLYPASGLRRHRFEMEHRAVVRMIHRVHMIWFRKAKDLIVNKFWCPGGLTTITSSLLTARRVMHCRPSCVFFAGSKIRPCRRDRFCPFCWARTAAAGYRIYKHAIRQERKKRDNLFLACHVIQHTLPAENFHSANGYSPEQVLTHANTLRNVLETHRALYNPLTKSLQRKTLGSAWRITVNPNDTGWQIEARQLFLCPGKKPLPVVNYAGAQVVFNEAVCARNDAAVMAVLGRFFEYPAGLVRSYSELAAVYLHASADIRTSSGTGLFRATGQSLVRKLKKEQADGAGSDQPELTDLETLDCFSPDVSM
jgi:hypothetical protein